MTSLDDRARRMGRAFTHRIGATWNRTKQLVARAAHPGRHA